MAEKKCKQDQGEKKSSRLRPYFASVTVWRSEDDPCEVGSYEFYASARSKDDAEKMIAEEVETYKCVRYNIHFFEFDTKTEHVINRGSRHLDNEIMGSEIREGLKKFIKRLPKKDYSSMRVEDLVRHPCYFYSFVARNLKPNSKIVFFGGELRIYNKRGETPFFASRMQLERERLQRELEKIVSESEERLKSKIMGLSCERLDYD